MLTIFHDAANYGCMLYCLCRFLWWVADGWRIIPGAMGQRYTLTYCYGFWSGRTRR